MIGVNLQVPGGRKTRKENASPGYLIRIRMGDKAGALPVPGNRKRMIADMVRLNMNTNLVIFSCFGVTPFSGATGTVSSPALPADTLPG